MFIQKSRAMLAAKTCILAHTKLIGASSHLSGGRPEKKSSILELLPGFLRFKMARCMAMVCSSFVSRGGCNFNSQEIESVLVEGRRAPVCWCCPLAAAGSKRHLWTTGRKDLLSFPCVRRFPQSLNPLPPGPPHINTPPPHK